MFGNEVVTRSVAGRECYGGDPVVDAGIDEVVSVVPVSPKVNGRRYNEPDGQGIGSKLAAERSNS
jgi:hypothetical protein